MATCADAAPATADPGSTAAPKASELPIPMLFQPVDASGGLLGIPRGSLPGIATPDMLQLPVANQLPGFEIVPLPAADAPAQDRAAVPDGAATTDGAAAPAG